MTAALPDRRKSERKNQPGSARLVGVLIRRVLPDDWELWRDIRLEALRSDPAEFGSTLAREQEFDEAHWRDTLSRGLKVVAEDPHPVGLVACSPEQDWLALYSMWVGPGHRGQGLGGALVKEVLDYAAEQRFPRVRLRVWAANHSARRLYSRMGFVDADGEYMDFQVS